MQATRFPASRPRERLSCRLLQSRPALALGLTSIGTKFWGGCFECARIASLAIFYCRILRKIARNAIFDPKKADVHKGANIPGKSVLRGPLFSFCASSAASRTGVDTAPTKRTGRLIAADLIEIPD